MLRTLSPWLLGAAFLPSLCVCGCAKKAAPTQQERAEAALEQALIAWTQGQSPDSWAGPDRKIQTVDPDWKAGYRLMSFLIAAAQRSKEDPNRVHCKVALSLKNPAGKSIEKQVVFEIVMGEQVRIARIGSK